MQSRMICSFVDVLSYQDKYHIIDVSYLVLNILFCLAHLVLNILFLVFRYDSFIY